jgi:hypothetical protein
MIVRRTEPLDPLCERCLKLLKIELAVVAFEISRKDIIGFEASVGIISLCRQCADIVESDGGEIIGCNESGQPLDPTHSWYRT